MPSPADLLVQLAAIANGAIAIAIGWHVVLLAAVGALIAGWRPTRVHARQLIALLFVSVATVGFAYGSYFNAIVFSGVAIGAFALVNRGLAGRVGAPAWQRWAGCALVGYGWIYPHFLAEPATTYLFAAPVGLLPCPTLSIAIGCALAAGLAAGAWGLVLALAGMFYGAFGVMRLGVELDVGLLAGATLLALAHVAHGRPPLRRVTVMGLVLLASPAAHARRVPIAQDLPMQCARFVPVDPDDDSPKAWNGALSFAACTQDTTLAPIATVDDVGPAVDRLARRLSPTASMYLIALELGPDYLRIRAAYHLGLAQLAMIVRARRSVVTTDPAVRAALEDALVPYLQASWLVFATLDEAARADPAIEVTELDPALIVRARQLRHELDAYAVPGLLERRARHLAR
jgi:hypothetical protein